MRNILAGMVLEVTTPLLDMANHVNYVLPLSALVATAPVAMFVPSPDKHLLQQQVGAHELASLLTSLVVVLSVDCSHLFPCRFLHCLYSSRLAEVTLEQGKQQNK